MGTPQWIPGCCEYNVRSYTAAGETRWILNTHRDGCYQPEWLAVDADDNLYLASQHRLTDFPYTIASYDADRRLRWKVDVGDLPLSVPINTGLESQSDGGCFGIGVNGDEVWVNLIYSSIANDATDAVVLLRIDKDSGDFVAEFSWQQGINNTPFENNLTLSRVQNFLFSSNGGQAAWIIDYLLVGLGVQPGGEMQVEGADDVGELPTIIAGPYDTGGASRLIPDTYPEGLIRGVWPYNAGRWGNGGSFGFYGIPKYWSWNGDYLCYCGSELATLTNFSSVNQTYHRDSLVRIDLSDRSPMTGSVGWSVLGPFPLSSTGTPPFELWEPAPSTWPNRARVCSQLADGAVIVGGGDAGLNENNLGVAKFDEAGSLAWETEIDSESEVQTLATDPDGNSVVMTTGGGTANIAYVDPDGVRQWRHRHAVTRVGGVTVGPQTLAFDGDGGIYALSLITNRAGEADYV